MKKVMVIAGGDWQIELIKKSKTNGQLCDLFEFV